MTMEEMDMRFIDEMFECWLARVEALVGRAVNREDARVVFEIFDMDTIPISPEEYAYELGLKL